MDEAKIRAIVQQEIQRNDSASRFSLNQIPRHTHNGTDSPNISQSSVVPVTRTIGSITMATNGADYSLGITFKPTRVDFYGVATNVASGFHVQIIGTCLVGAGNHFQPGTTRYVVTGPITESNVQGCSFMVIRVSGGVTTSVAGVSEQAIVDAFYPNNSTTVARATITAVKTDSITVSVVLAAGWSINGTWVIS